MKKIVALMFFCAGIFAAAVHGEGTAAGNPLDFRAFWDNGLRFETVDKMFRFEIGGRLDNDWSWMTADDKIKTTFGIKDGTEYRRARISLAGTFYEHVIFKTEYDFAKGDASFRDLFFGVKEIPVLGTIRTGHFYESFMMDDMMSTNYNMCIETSASNVFAPKRNTGIAASNAVLNNRLTWTLGVFKETGNYGESGTKGGSNITGRITGLPWHPDKTKLLHLGFSYSYRNPQTAVQYKIGPESHLAPVFLDTGAFDARHINLANGEFAFLYGPFTFQAESVNAICERDQTDDLNFSGCYAQAGFMLTGESRSYNEANACFAAVKPNKYFLSKEGGFGALEIVARYSTVDLNSKEIQAGELGDLTVGLNWFWNANTKVMFNYIRSNLKDAYVGQEEFSMIDSESSDIFVVRFHIDF
jgi:phosphate-selective porin OprO and OprP